MVFLKYTISYGVVEKNLRRELRLIDKGYRKVS